MLPALQPLTGEGARGHVHPSRGFLNARGLAFARAAFGLLIVLFWVAMVVRDWQGLAESRWTIDAPSAFASLVAFAVYFVALGVGWTLVARGLGHGLPLSGGLSTWLLSMPARYVPGNVWHIAARVRLAGRYNVPAPGVVTASALEQALTVISAAGLGLLWLPARLGSHWVAPIGLAFLACLLLLQPPVLNRGLRIAARLFGKAAPNVPLDYRRMAALATWYCLVNALNGLAFALLASATGGSTSIALVPVLASAYCLAYVVGYVSLLTPSGVGVREAALASMLSLYLPAGAAITLSLLARLFSTAGEALAVLLVGIPLVRRSR